MNLPWELKLTSDELKYAKSDPCANVVKNSNSTSKSVNRTQLSGSIEEKLAGRKTIVHLRFFNGRAFIFCCTGKISWSNLEPLEFNLEHNHLKFQKNIWTNYAAILIVANILQALIISQNQ